MSARRAMWLAVIVALLGISCSAGSGTASAKALRYVALGDSYASGEGDPPFDPGTDIPEGAERDLCHRSTGAYPRRLKLDASVILIHRACSGAVTANVTSTAQYLREPLQLQWLDDKTDLVTVTIGGNDAGFATTLVNCLLNLRGCSAIDPTVPNRIAAMATTLPTVFQQIRERAPNARIFVVGYPNIFPPASGTGPGPCPRLQAFGRGLGIEELVWLRARAKELAAVIAGAAAAAGVKYVDVDSAFHGHEVCTKKPWVNGLQVRNHLYSFHPTQDGNAQIAKRVSAAINRDT